MDSPTHQELIEHSPLLNRKHLRLFKRPIFAPITSRAVPLAEARSLARPASIRSPAKPKKTEYITWTFWDLQGRIIQVPTAFMYSYARHANPNTVRQYAYDLSQFFRTIDLTLAECELNPDRPNPFPGCHTVDEVLLRYDEQDVGDYLALLQQSVETVTAKRHEAAMQKLFKFMTGRFAGPNGAYRSDVPWTATSDGKLRSMVGVVAMPVKVHLSASEIILLLNALGPEADRVVIQFLYETGMRLEELLNLTLAEIYAEIARQAGKTIEELLNSNDPLLPVVANYYVFEVRGNKSRASGKPKMRKTFMARAFFNRMLAYHRSFRYRFAKQYIGVSAASKPAFLDEEGNPYTEKKLRYRLARASRRVGSEPHRFIPKSMRSSAAQNALSSNLGKKLIDRLLLAQSLLGHASLETTQKSYVDVQQFLLESGGKELLDLPTQSERICQSTKAK